MLNAKLLRFTFRKTTIFSLPRRGLFFKTCSITSRNFPTHYSFTKMCGVLFIILPTENCKNQMRQYSISYQCYAQFEEL